MSFMEFLAYIALFFSDCSCLLPRKQEPQWIPMAPPLVPMGRVVPDDELFSSELFGRHAYRGPNWEWVENE